MNTIAWNEVVSRRMLLVAGLLAGVVSLVKPFGHPEALLAVTGAIAMVFAVVSGLAVGAGLLGRDLVENRLSFWFNQPVSGWAIFAGKFLGGAAVVLAGTLLVELPALVAGFGSFGLRQLGFGAALLGTAAVAAVALGIVAGIQLRILSSWTLVDLLLAGALVWVAGHGHALVDAAMKSRDFHAIMGALRTEAGFALLGVCALLAAGAASVVVGRTDPARARRALSLTLLATLAPLGIAFWIWAHALAS